MRREISLLLIILTLVAGCNMASAPPTTSPFETGRTVPAPGTGAIGGGAPTGPSAWSMTDNQPGRCPTAPLTAPGGDAPSTQPRHSVVQTIQPRHYDSGSSATPIGSASQPGSGNTIPGSRPVVDIMDLPPPDSASTNSNGGNIVSVQHLKDVRATDRGSQIPCGCETDQVRPAQFTARSQTEAVSNEARVDSTGRFAYAADYSWLRGRLEYSQLDRCWKLRYIRAGDAIADDFGGSVIIADPSILDGAERGDIIEVHGQLGGKDGKTRGFSPIYFVNQIRMITSAQ